MEQSLQNIVFTDLVSFLAFELDQSAEAIRYALWAEPSRIPSLLEKINQSELFQWSPTVSAPIYHGGPSRGAALVEANVQLQPAYITRLVERQVKSADTPIGPISVELTSGVLYHFREKITAKLGALLSEARKSSRGGVGGIHRLVAASPELCAVQGVFEEVVNSLLGNPQMLQTIVLALSSTGAAGAGFKDGINAALVAIAVLSLHSRSLSPDAKKQQLIEIGMAAVLQDVSLLSDPSTSLDDHADLSAELASQLGAAESVVSLILFHHALKTPDGTPMLKNPEVLSAPARVLVATNTYLGMVEQNLPGGTVEVIKRLNRLSAKKYIDDEAVRIINKMCMPSVKAAIIDGANDISLQCKQKDNSAIPWPVAGDRIPAVLICKNPLCHHRASQTISLSRNLPFIVDGRLISMISSGDYRVCSFLSSKLKTLYASVQAQISHQQ